MSCEFLRWLVACLFDFAEHPQRDTANGSTGEEPSQLLHISGKPIVLLTPISKPA
jgi:hypothetical protein